MRSRLLVTILTALLSPAVIRAATPGKPVAPLNDTTIRSILEIVARRQPHPLGEVIAGPFASLASAPPPPAGIAWNYPWGVTLYGALRSTDATGDRGVEDFVLAHNQTVARYFSRLASLAGRTAGTPAWETFARDPRQTEVAGLLRLGDLDSCGAMGTQLLEGMLRHPDRVTPEQRGLAARVADWILHRQERLTDGTFWRPNLPGADNIWRRDALWIDDLYMSCPFLVRWSQLTGDPAPLHDAARQIINMAARLQDTDGLWFHAWFALSHQHSPYKWGRANGWALVATVEVLSALPGDHPDRAPLLAILRRHIAGLKARQPTGGVWPQVLDHPELWPETSCTAMFAYSIARAVNRGWIESDNWTVAQKAFAGLKPFITPAGVVQGTCEGTNIGLTLDYYADRRRPDDNMHARGVVLLAGTELLKHTP